VDNEYGCYIIFIKIGCIKRMEVSGMMWLSVRDDVDS
jgi:hypothetical protein